MNSYVQPFGEAAENVAIGVRLARDLPGRLRTPISPTEARTRVRRGLASRECRVLGLAERYIYSRPRSPYRTLLEHAGCELGDLRRLVESEGVEGALSILAAQGVYVRIDEFKGARDVVRGSLRFTPKRGDFEHPSLRSHLLLHTGGSGRRPSRVPYSLGFLAEWAVSVSVVAQAHGLERPAQVFWWPVPLAHTMIAGMLGHAVAGWFYPVHPLPHSARWAARYVAMLGRLAGCRFPAPRRCGPHEARRLASWLVVQSRTRGKLLVWATPTASARLASAAAEAGMRLDDVTFLATGEPITGARRVVAESVGATVIAGYSSVDVSAPAYACATGDAVDDMHVMADRCALITHSRLIDHGMTVDALLSTSLSGDSPRIAFNTETGDYGQVARRTCGCLLGELGLHTHVSDIRSFEKLTGEGVTFVRSDLQHILEQVLPVRFGGNSFDYQLSEERDAGFETRLVIRVSPSVGDVDSELLIEAFLTALRRTGPQDAYHARLWERAGTLVVRREMPRLTSAGKVLPLDSDRGRPTSVGHPPR